MAVGMVWQGEHEAAGHVMSTVRKKREMNTGGFCFNSVMIRVPFPLLS